MAGRIHREQVEEPVTFEQFYEAHVDEVHGFLRVRSSAEVAEELTAEVFISAFKNWDQGERLRSGWLITVARRKLVDEWRRTARKRNRFQNLVPFVKQSNPGPQAATETRVLVLQVLDRLPEVQRQVLVLRYLDDHPVPAVAERIQRSYEATESLLSRARGNFEKHYAQIDRQTETAYPNVFALTS